MCPPRCNRAIDSEQRFNLWYLIVGAGCCLAMDNIVSGVNPMKAGNKHAEAGALSFLYADKKKTVLVMVSVFALLFALHLYHLYVYYADGVHIKFLDFNYEHNLPTFFAALNLIISGYLLIHIARSKAPADYRRAWMVLGFIFFFLALDEWGMIHDGRLKDYREVFTNYDHLWFLWVIPYSILVIVFGVAYLKFFLHLPDKYKWLFALSGGLFVFGALVMEVIGAPRAKHGDREDILYVLYTTIEESLEFIAIILFNFTLIAYIEDYVTNRKNPSSGP
jgi:hypothetical protein